MEARPLIYTYRCIKKSNARFISGEHEVRIRISQFNDKQFIPLGYSSSIENWDDEFWLPKPSHPHYKNLLKKINQLLDDIAFEVKLAEDAGRFISCLEVKHKVMHKDTNLLRQKSQLKILELFDKIIANLEAAGKPGYADAFEATRSTVSKLINDNEFIPPDKRDREKDKPFLAFTKEDHENYEKLISDGTSDSTISFYLRTYYHIWNIAIKEGIVPRNIITLPGTSNFNHINE